MADVLNDGSDVLGGDSGGGPTNGVVGANLAALGAPAVGTPAVVDLTNGNYERLVRIDAGWVGTDEHVMLDTSDAWGLDLSNYPLASIRNSYRRFYSALPYGKARTWLTSAATAGATTLNVSDTTDFAASGTVRIRGDNVAYTGKTLGTFTGVSGLTVNAPQDATIITQGEVGGWGTAVVPMGNVAAMYTAGFHLQIRMTAFLNGSFDHKSMTIGAYMFHGNEGESISLPAATATGGLGMGATLTGPADDFVTQRHVERAFQQIIGDWQNLAVTPSKDWLWCALYGKMDDAAANDNGEVYACQVMLRWAS